MVSEASLYTPAHVGSLNFIPQASNLSNEKMAARSGKQKLNTLVISLFLNSYGILAQFGGLFLTNRKEDDQLHKWAKSSQKF
jgi:hypothetical protein